MNNTNLVRNFVSKETIRPILYSFIGIVFVALAYFHDNQDAKYIAMVFCVVWSLLGFFKSISSFYSVLLLIPALLLHDNAPLFIALISFVLFAVYRDIVSIVSEKKDLQIKSVKNEVRNAEYQEQVIHRHLERFPKLLQACFDFSTAKHIEQFASFLSNKILELIPNANSICVFSKQKDGIKLICKNTKKTTINDKEKEHLDFIFSENKLFVDRKNGLVTLYVPLSNEHITDAAFSVSFPTHGLDDHLIIEIMDALSHLAEISLSSIALLQQAQSLALTDDLTGLFGRHEFFRRLKEEISNTYRDKTSISVIMCDMDHLKKFNDKHGHQAGDQAIRAIADVIKNTVPKTAIACRYGGEEFGILFKNSNTEEIAEELHENINALPLCHGDRLSASIGFAALIEKEDANALVHRADMACFKAKENGRNRVEAAT